MSNGKKWEGGYRPDRYYGKGEGQTACPNGRAKCGCCSDPEKAAYKRAKACPLSDDWAM